MNFMKNMFIVLGLSFIGFHYINAMEQKKKQSIEIPFDDAMSQMLDGFLGTDFISFINNKRDGKISYSIYNSTKRTFIDDIDEKFCNYNKCYVSKTILLNKDLVNFLLNNAKSTYDELMSIVDNRKEISKKIAEGSEIRYIINPILKKITINIEQ